MNAGLDPDFKSIVFSFEGREIRCRPGLSIAAALTDAHELELRNTLSGDNRGLFCGMGVCQECRVMVNGERGVRACMTTVTSGSTVLKEKYPVSTATDNTKVVKNDDLEILSPEILVIGAGPAGLTAASIAAESGAEVVVLDERKSTGGQYYKQPMSVEGVPDFLAGDRQFSDGNALIERLKDSGATVESGSQVWGAFAPREFSVFDGRCNRIYKPKCAIVATGAYERALPMPGWTLPGVMTTGAAQTMLRSYGILPGNRILVAGNGPFNFQVALELKLAGADVVAVAELAEKPGASWASNGFRMALSAPDLAMNGIRYLLGLRKTGIPVLYGRGLVRMEKTSAGLRAFLGQAGNEGFTGETFYDADIVCMGYGFQPNNEILRSLGCRHIYDERRGHLVPKRDSNCETTVSGVYAAGDCSGLQGAPSALQDGIIASIAAIRRLGHPVSTQHEKEWKKAARELGRQRIFQSALWKVFSAPRFQTELARPDTVICRCENVCLADVDNAIADGAESIGTIKRQTRLGMGACQGRYCAPVVAAQLAKRYDRPIDEYSLFAPRTPIKPVRIADILSTE